MKIKIVKKGSSVKPAGFCASYVDEPPMKPCGTCWPYSCPNGERPFVP